MDAAKGFDAYLQYHSMIDPGIMLLKNGAYLVGFLYQGPDLESSTNSDAEWLSMSFNNAIKRLDVGWMVHQVVVRTLSQRYPEGFFEEPTNALIDEERLISFTKEGTHYETFAYIFLTYLPPKHTQGGFMKKLGDFLMGGTHEDDMDYISRDIAHVNRIIKNFETSFSQTTRFKRLSYSRANDELLQALNVILNQKNHPCPLPDPPDGLDSWLARDVENGELFVYDGKLASVITVEGFPMYSRPGMLAEVEQLPMEIAWSSRFIVTDQQYARKKIDSDRRKWRQKIYPFLAKMMNNPNAPADQYALQMVDELNTAMALIEQGTIIYGHYTSTVVVKAENEDTLQRLTGQTVKLFERMGFSARVERMNSMEAFLGSLPGHGRENIRKPFLHSLNYSDLAPLTTNWSGSEFCPCPPPNYPPNSPPLMQAASVGTTPFRLNLHVDDVGHTLVLGPTGAGKSTLLAILVSQFERYEGSQVFVFDKGYSMFALTSACDDAVHYDLGDFARSGGLCPLADLDAQADRGWAGDFINTLLELQIEDNKSDTVSSEDRNLIREAINILADSTQNSEDRTMTSFISTVQSAKARSLLSYYQIGGGTAGDFLDGARNDIKYKSLVTFEIQELMQYGKNIVVPVLLFLFRQIEKRLTGRPTLLIIDEAWLALSTPVFAGKIKEWLKVLRKSNCAVILATQNVADIAESSITSALVESCPTKIFLPNPDARNQTSSELYQKVFGLNERQVAIIASAVRKRQYYLVSPAGRRLFSLDLGPIALSFVGAGSKEDIARIKELMEQHGSVWPYYWLEGRGLKSAAEAWFKAHDIKMRAGMEASA
jgi:type IV secretion system protein VirB4